MSNRDYLDELIDLSKEADPEFARTWRARELARTLAEKRKAQGMTQEQVAQRMGVARPRVAEIERRPEGVAFARILRYAEAVGADLTVA